MKSQWTEACILVILCNMLVQKMLTEIDTDWQRLTDTICAYEMDWQTFDRLFLLVFVDGTFSPNMSVSGAAVVQAMALTQISLQ